MSDSQDDNGADDPILRSMRSVWVSMRDEEPSSRGLADLLAAARVKAEELQPREPWWRRAFAVMLRPPVLAAATVVVLIGGAVVINRRSDELQTPMHAPASGSAEATTTTALATPQDRLEGQLGGPSGADIQSNDTKSDRVVREVPADPPAIATPHRPRLPSPPPHNSNSAPAQESRDNGVAQGAGSATAVDDKAKNQVVDQRPGTGGLVIAREEADSPTIDTAPQVDATATTKPATSSESQARSAGVAVEQLVKQAEVAAGRGDCPAVRVTADRIRKLDVAVYKARVAKQAAIARCLK